MLCCEGVVVVVTAIVTIIIVACLPFIHCRCCHFLFNFHRTYIHVHWHSSSVTVLVYLLLFLLLLPSLLHTYYRPDLIRSASETSYEQSVQWQHTSENNNNRNNQTNNFFSLFQYKYTLTRTQTHTHLSAMRNKVPCYCIWTILLCSFCWLFHPKCCETRIILSTFRVSDNLSFKLLFFGFIYLYL